MERLTRLLELRDTGSVRWVEPEQGWEGRLNEILGALVEGGFQECRHEVVKSRRDSRPIGGVWQGLNCRTGLVASAVWVHRPGAGPVIVFVEVDGERLRG